MNVTTVPLQKEKINNRIMVCLVHVLQQQELVEALNRQHELSEEIREKKSCIEALEDTKRVQDADYKKLTSEFEALEKRNKDLVVMLDFHHKLFIIKY